ncbi:hypothetical protein CI41S_21330 [Bradyrhizobium ivorense]|nr:transposase [Bradyrhizobium ivorense]VIO69886.1 hypothetical protein CI41S_21330 [Bradyrhizobium ivorense]
MGQILHGCATTTEAVRRAIQNSQERWLSATNPIERLNGEIKRRTEVVGIFLNEDAIVRLIGAILLEQNDEWAVQRDHYMTLETIAPLSDDRTVDCS